MERCPNCDYDLTGLDLPHRCPECGYLADPPAEREAAVAWYASWKGLFFREPPGMALAYLGDRRCRRRARRRALLLLLVPWVAATLLILLGTSIQVVRTHERWWETAESPGKRLHYRERTETDRLLAFDFRWLFPYDGFDLVREGTRHDNTSTSLRLTWPAPDALTLLVFIIPLAIGLLAVVFLAGGLRIHAAATHRTIEGGGLWALAMLLASWYTTAVFCLLVATAGFVAIEIRPHDGILTDILGGFLWVGLGVYCFGGVYVLFRSVRTARPYARGLLHWLGLILLNLGWLLAVVGTWVLAAVVVEAFD